VIDRPYPGDRPRHAADGALKLVRGRTARLVTGAVQAAAIRRRIRIPLRFADDYSTTATVVSFTGLTRAALERWPDRRTGTPRDQAPMTDTREYPPPTNLPARPVPG